MTSPAQMVREIHEIAYKICNEWEMNFIQDMRKKVVEGGDQFTPKQKAVIERLYEKACRSPY